MAGMKKDLHIGKLPDGTPEFLLDIADAGTRSVSMAVSLEVPDHGADNVVDTPSSDKGSTTYNKTGLTRKTPNSVSIFFSPERYHGKSCPFSWSGTSSPGQLNGPDVPTYPYD